MEENKSNSNVYNTKFTDYKKDIFVSKIIDNK